MALEDRKLFGETHRDLPGTAYPEAAPAALRASRRGELYVQPLHSGKMHDHADEGNYFVATNPTVGTGVAGIAASDGFNDLESFLFLRNTDTPGAQNAKRIYLDYIMLQPTAAGTNGTNFSYAMKIDKGNTRVGTGGAAVTPVNPNMDSTATSVATVQSGAVASTAASADARLVTSGLLRTTIKVVGDTYLFVFGEVAHAAGVQAATITNFIVPCPPVVLGPGHMFLLHEFGASQTVAAAYTFQMGWWER